MNLPSLSYSDLQSFGRCPKQYHYRAILRIQPKRKSAALREGAAIHLVMQRVALGENLDDVIFQMANEVNANPTLFADEAEEQTEMLKRVGRIVDGYYEYWDDDWTVLHVEEQFTIRLENIMRDITFTPDLVVKDRYDNVWILDHKSTNSLPDAGVPFADLQALLYFAGVKAVYPECKGFYFDYLRKKEPTQPRLNKTHNEESKAFGYYFVNNLKSIDTTYEVLRDFLFELHPALLEEPSHKARLAELYDNNRFYYRDQLVVTDVQVRNVLGDVVKQVNLIQAADETDSYPRVFQRDGVLSCERCNYYRICQAELLGWDVDRIQSEEYEPLDTSYKDYETEEV
jgi:hypothetical protein